MVNVASGHFRLVAVRDPADGSKKVKKWQCRHCEQNPQLNPKLFAEKTSPTSRMNHVTNVHSGADPPPKVTPPPSSASSLSIIQPPAKRRKTDTQLNINTAFIPLNNTAFFPAIALLFARCGIAHHIVEKPEWIAAFDAYRHSTVRLPNRRQLLQHQSLLAQSIRVDVIRRLRQYCNACPLTVGIDGWTNVRKDKVTNVVILCGGVAYYWCSIVNTSNHNTAVWLKGPMMEVLDTIKAEGLMFSSLVTDNEEANKCLHKLLRPHYPFLIRSPCTAHLLQLCVRKALVLPAIEPIMTAMEELLAKFKYKEARLKLKTLQLTATNTYHCLVRPNDTRWSSWLYASRRLLKLKVYCDVVVPQPPQFWVDLDEITRFLSPFQMATDIMQSDSSTIYELYQQFTSILRHVDSTPPNSCFHSAVDDIHNLVLTVLDDHVDMDLVVACSLLSFDTHTAALFPDRLKKAEKAFVEFAARYTFYWNCAGHSTIAEARSQSFAEWTSWNARAPGSGFEEMEDEVSRLKSHYMYCNRQTSSNGTQFARWNPRLAWANHIRTSPVISLGAIALLSVAGSEAAVERTFSAQGKVHSKGRNRLRDDSVEAEMFCRFNSAALERKVQEKDTGQWTELTEDYEEVQQVVTAGLFLARVALEQKEHEEEKQRDREEADRDRINERGESAEEKKEEQAPVSSVNRIPDPPLPATADDVHRFVVDYVKRVPWPSGIHAKFRWTERYLGHLSNAAVNWTPPIDQTDKVLQAKIMKYVRANSSPSCRE